MPVNPIPEGYHTITPYLIVENGKDVIEFLKNAFGAKQSSEPIFSPQGKLRHAELLIGNSHIMLSEANEEYKAMPVMLYLYVEDVDEVYKQAIEAGGKSIKEPSTQYYGDRSGGVMDCSGNQWWIGTHVEDVAPDEIKRRAELASREKLSKTKETFT